MFGVSFLKFFPFSPALIWIYVVVLRYFFIFPMENLDICPLRCDNNEVKKISLWACSAVGSAPHSHCGGRRFESDQVHKKHHPFSGWCFCYHLCYFCSIGLFYGTKKLFTPATSPSASLPNVASSWAEAPSPSSISILGIVE